MLNSIIAWLAEHCRNSVVDEKWLLVEQLRVGQQWKDRLTRSGCSHINLHAKTMRLIVNELSAPWLAAAALVPVGRSGLELLVDRTVAELAMRQQLVYFRVSDTARPALSRLLVRTYNDWRLAGLNVEHLNAAAMEVPAKAADLALIFKSIREWLASTRQVDYADCISGVIEACRSDRLTIPKQLQLLQPETFPLTKRERDLLELLCQRGAAWHPPQSVNSLPSPLDSPIKLTRQVAIGEVNEVRGLFQHCFASTDGPTPCDMIEVLASDYERYAPLVLENLWQWLSDHATTDTPADVLAHASKYANHPSLSSAATLTIDKLPITFAEGVACIYSRPGRLLRSWIRWADSDYLQSKAVQILREGLVNRPPSAATIGYARLASTLRSLPIGFGHERYLPQIQNALETARRDTSHRLGRDPDYEGDYGSATLQALLDTVTPLVSLAPPLTASASQLLESARQLLMNHARAESVMDRYARAKLVEDIEGMLVILRDQSDALANVRTWLEELPMQSRLFSSTPRPGCLHVAPLEQGGASGRSRVFMLGLDDRKFARRQLVDPILLDAERARISADLSTSDQLASHQQAAIDRVLQRLQGIDDARVVLSHSAIDMSDDSECFLSPAVARMVTLDVPTSKVAFVAATESQLLTTSEAFYRELLVDANRRQRNERLFARFPRIRQQRDAQAQQYSETYGPYDGWVPQAGIDLLASATSHPMSPSRLEMLGSCPRKYFFARALGVSPPDEWTVDPDRWLTALDMGTFLHELFEEFLRELQVLDQTPDPSRHAQRLADLLAVKIEQMTQRVPVHNPEAFHRQREELAETCEIFLQKEYEYAEARHAKTWIMEASLGSLTHSQPHASTEIDTDQPIIIELRSGRKLYLCGRIDRIDRRGQAKNPEHLIWDYKTGSDWGYDQGDPIQQGRKLQPLLYTRMLASRLAELGRNPQSVRSFGYFFPSPRTEGLRYEWTVDQLADGNDTLESMLDLLSAGTFIATNAKEDCGYCDYQNVCGAAQELVAISNLKSEHTTNAQLEAWRALRS